jgi:hypothetical protein
LQDRVKKYKQDWRVRKNQNRVEGNNLERRGKNNQNRSGGTKYIRKMDQWNSVKKDNKDWTF